MQGGGANPVNLLPFGASGMVGSEALHAALDEPRVTRVVAIVRWQPPHRFSSP